MAIRRILAIDGGVALGIFPAAFLAKALREQTQHPIADDFDLIAGCSTGGILALGLNLQSEELVQFYKISVPKIFGKKKNFLQFLTSSPIYKTKKLQQELEAVMGTKLLGNTNKRLVIPAWNCLTRKPKIYKQHITKNTTSITKHPPSKSHSLPPPLRTTSENTPTPQANNS